MLDLDSAEGRFRLYLCIPVHVVCAGYSSLQEWQRHLAALFPHEEGARAVGTQVYIDGGSYAQARHPDDCACADHDAGLMSFGCSIYALSGAAADIRAGEPLQKWLKTQAALAVVWAPSEEAARYNAYLYCARLGYQPTEPASH